MASAGALTRSVLWPPSGLAPLSRVDGQAANITGDRLRTVARGSPMRARRADQSAHGGAERRLSEGGRRSGVVVTAATGARRASYKRCPLRRSGSGPRAAGSDCDPKPIPCQRHHARSLRVGVHADAILSLVVATGVFGRARRHQLTRPLHLSACPGAVGAVSTVCSTVYHG